MILFTSDLLFGSKILGAAKYAGLRGQGIRSRAALAQHAPIASWYFLDLEAELAEQESAEVLLEAALCHPQLRVVAFAGHLQTDALKAAHERLTRAGSTHEVHSRGSLNARLSAIIPPLAAPAQVTPPRVDGVL